MIEKQIIELYTEGLGRKLISQKLGCSEYKVRTVIRGYQTQLLHTKAPKVKSELRVANLTRNANSPVTKAIILSDIHIPYHCPKALKIALEYTKDYDPNVIILNGDIVDMYSVSSYRKDPIRINTLQDELNETRSFLNIVRNQHKKAAISYIAGNHEYRMEKFLLDKAGELSSLECLSLDELLGVKDLDIKFYDYGKSLFLGNLQVTHGDVSRKGSSMSAKAHMDKSGGSVLIGHCHRLGTIYKTNRWGTHIGIENGYLGRKDFEYVGEMVDWQQGFTQVDFYQDGKFFVRQHRIEEGALYVDGVLYEAR